MKVRHWLLSLLILFSFACKHKEIVYEYKLNEIEVKASTIIKFNKNNIGEYLPEYVLVAITNHECFANAQVTERIFMMEAVWNRVQDNYGNHGLSLSDQLLAINQFTGLFIYRPGEFSIDFNNPKTKHLVALAKEIIYNHKRIYPESRIYYWAGTCDSDGYHGKWVRKNQLKTLIKTKNIFA